MQKPNLTTVLVELRFRELFCLDLWPTNRISFLCQISMINVQIINKLKT